MKEDIKSSIIKEAITDFNAIKDAANINAKNKLAKEFPNKFNNLLKEELKNNTIKESYKKLDETYESDNSDDIESNNEHIMKNTEKETKKVENVTGKVSPNNVTKKVDEDVKITDTVGDGDPFKVNTKKTQKVDETIVNNKNINNTSKKQLQTEEFNITELSMQNIGSALEGAEDDDEIITMDEIENEINSMNLDDNSEMNDDDNSEMNDDDNSEMNDVNDDSNNNDNTDDDDDTYSKLIEIKSQLDTILSSMNQNAEVDEMHSAGGVDRFGDKNQVNQLHQGNPLIDEEGITDADIEAVLGGENEVDESHGVTYGSRRNSVGRHTPSTENLSQGELDQSPEYVQESKKKVNSLIKENKELTKKLNESKKHKQSVGILIEQYKSALEKYRNQLKEMATFNTNLAHVNNLLVNESLALTQNDKIKIIKEFKMIDSIENSQIKYREMLAEMQGTHKTLTESIETKVSASVQPSSKQKINEVVEQTAYNAQLTKIKKVMKYMDSRGKK